MFAEFEVSVFPELPELGVLSALEVATDPEDVIDVVGEATSTER